MNKCQSKEELEDEDQSPFKKLLLKQQQQPQTNDLVTWKKRNNVNPEDKVFQIKGSYQEIRKGLLQRGWVENTEVGSVCFDLRWTCKLMDIDFARLEEG